MSGRARPDVPVSFPPTARQQLQLEELGHRAGGLTRDEADVVIAGLSDLDAHERKPVPAPLRPTGRQLRYIRALRRRLDLRGPVPRTRAEATMLIVDLRALQRARNAEGPDGVGPGPQLHVCPIPGEGRQDSA